MKTHSTPAQTGMADLGFAVVKKATAKTTAGDKARLAAKIKVTGTSGSTSDAPKPADQVAQ